MGEETEGTEPYQILIRPEAADEMAEAYEWYKGKAPGLGADFRRALDERLLSIEQSPIAYPIVHNQIRRALLRRFPYGLFYIIDHQTVIVLACFHASRDPKHWQGRLENVGDD